MQASDFYYENGIEARFGVRATRVDAADKAVELDGGERLVYDKLLVATGVSNRRVPIPGISLDSIYGLHTVADSDRIRAEIAPRRTAVVGMGFIGSEVAASLRQSGVEVAVVDRNTVPLRRVLGEEVGRVNVPDLLRTRWLRSRVSAAWSGLRPRTVAASSATSP